MLTEPSQQQEKALFYWLKIREKEQDMLVREKGAPLVRRPPIRMGIGVLLFNIPYYLIRLDSADGESVSLSASSAGDAASRNVVSGQAASGEKESLGSDGNASVVSDSSSGADLAD